MPQVDVITGDKRHRRWTAEEKQSIVAAAFSPGVRPIDIARRANISSGQLYTWRKELAQAGEVSFAPVVTVAEEPEYHQDPPAIELEYGGMRIRIAATTPPALVKAIVNALVQR
jgi:transposase